jgi:hypothetical protein
MEYATTVSTLVTPGNFGRGIELGLEIAERAAKITGEQVTFVKSQSGDYAAIEWITNYASVQALQAAGDKLNADVSFLDLLDKKVPGVYESGLGVTQQTIFRKVF